MDFRNEFSELAPAARAWQVSELAGGVGRHRFHALRAGDADFHTVENELAKDLEAAHERRLPED